MNDKQFTKIVNTYQGLVYTVCYQMVKDKQIAEDLTQETFVSAYNHIDSCSPLKYKPWLVRIASNKASDYLKSAWKRRVTVTDEFDDENITLISTEEKLISIEEIKEIKALINSLKEPYLFVSQLYFIEDKTPEEIASILNRPIKTVNTQLYRSKKLLQQKINERRNE